MTSAALTYTSVEDITKIREHLKATFNTGKSLPLAWRKNQLLQLCYLLKENKSRFFDAFKTDLGRHQLETSVAEIDSVISEAVCAWKNVDTWAKPEGVPFNMNFSIMRPKIMKQPKGVVLVIGPFNYPIMCSLSPLVGAIAAGCAGVLKLSELVPNISGLLTELWPKYMDTDLYQIVNGAVSETTALLDLQWDHILFTGSPAVGKIVAAAAAKHLTPTTLELGGQCPVFLDAEHTDLQTATRRLLWGKTINVGQTCLAPNHVFVPAKDQDAVVAAIKKTYSEFYPEGAAKSDSVARIVADRHFDRLKGILEKTKGQVVVGGESDKGTRFLSPTVVKDVSLDDSLMQDELFGPILPIVPVKDFDEALQFTNSREHPLALYVFSNDDQFKQKVLASTQSGAISMNEVCIHLAVPGLPFGGIGTSGMGAYTGKFGFDAFTHQRPTLDNPRWTDMLFSWRYPPYTDAKIKQSASLAPKIPAPRPGPGIAPVTSGAWFSWVGRRKPVTTLIALLVVLTVLQRRSSLLWIRKLAITRE